jgi:hypothetical protein
MGRTVMGFGWRVELTSSPIAERFADRERSSAPAQILHNNPEFLPEANTASARTTAIKGHRSNELFVHACSHAARQ